jgi:hypothetical protein
MTPSPGYLSRVWEMLHVCGPQSWPTLLATRADLDRAAATLADARASAGEVAAARRLRAAVLHPDTGVPIPLPLRMAAHVPVNTILLVGMCGAASPAAVGAWQVLNQTFNAAQFYANRNASNDVPDETLALSFFAAVSASLAVGVGAARWADARAAAAAAGARGRGWLQSAAAARHLRVAVPFLAAAAAKPLQIGLLRADELAAGVVVRDEDGAPRGRSVRAGRFALATTVATRVLYLAPMLFLPHAHAAACAALPRAPPLLLYVALAAASSAAFTPLALALFSQQARLPADALEPQFRALARAQGGPVRILEFNKGL